MWHNFFDEASDIYSLYDKDLNLIDVNKAFLTTFRLNKSDIIGKNITQLAPDSVESGRYDKFQEVLRTGHTISFDDFMTHPSYGNFCFRIKIFKVGDGLGAVSTNITDLTEAINDLEAFIYKASHDLRAPITSILGLMHLSEFEATDFKELKRLHRLMAQQTGKLDNILKILIETTQIRTESKTIDEIDFQQLLNNLLTTIELSKGAKKIKFELNINTTKAFFSDKNLLMRLFQNLLDNAIKYKNESTANAFVKIDIQDEQGGINISIEDNGIGIPQHLQKKVFTIFFRGSDKVKGNGLGLYTVKHTVKKLGGHITLQSEEGKGSMFKIYLPHEKIKTS